MDAIGKHAAAARHRYLSFAKPVEQLRSSWTVKTGQTKRQSAEVTRRQPLLRFNEDASVETGWVRRRGFVDPVAGVLAVNGRRRNEQRATGRFRQCLGKMPQA